MSERELFGRSANISQGKMSDWLALVAQDIDLVLFSEKMRLLECFYYWPKSSSVLKVIKCNVLEGVVVAEIPRKRWEWEWDCKFRINVIVKLSHERVTWHVVIVMVKKRNFDIQPPQPLNPEPGTHLQSYLPPQRTGKATRRTSAPFYHISFSSFIYSLSSILLLLVFYHLLKSQWLHIL